MEYGLNFVMNTLNVYLTDSHMYMKKIIRKIHEQTYEFTGVCRDFLPTYCYITYIVRSFVQALYIFFGAVNYRSIYPSSENKESSIKVRRNRELLVVSVTRISKSCQVCVALYTIQYIQTTICNKQRETHTAIIHTTLSVSVTTVWRRLSSNKQHLTCVRCVSRTSCVRAKNAWYMANRRIRLP